MSWPAIAPQSRRGGVLVGLNGQKSTRYAHLKPSNFCSSRPIVDVLVGDFAGAKAAFYRYGRKLAVLARAV